MEQYVDTYYSNMYLTSVYSELVKWHEFSLKCFDQFYKTYQPPKGGAKMLEFGGGSTICNILSAATVCKEIIFAEYRPGRTIVNG